MFGKTAAVPAHTYVHLADGFYEATSITDDVMIALCQIDLCGKEAKEYNQWNEREDGPIFEGSMRPTFPDILTANKALLEEECEGEGDDVFEEEYPPKEFQTIAKCAVSRLDLSWIESLLESAAPRGSGHASYTVGRSRSPSPPTRRGSGRFPSRSPSPRCHQTNRWRRPRDFYGSVAINRKG